MGIEPTTMTPQLEILNSPNSRLEASLYTCRSQKYPTIYLGNSVYLFVLSISFFTLKFSISHCYSLRYSNAAVLLVSS